MYIVDVGDVNKCRDRRVRDSGYSFSLLSVRFNVVFPIINVK